MTILALLSPADKSAPPPTHCRSCKRRLLAHLGCEEIGYCSTCQREAQDVADVLSAYEFPVAAELVEAAAILARGGYPEADALAILGHCSRHKSAECCPLIRTDADRDAIEDALPRDPAWASWEWDRDTWATTA